MIRGFIFGILITSIFFNIYETEKSWQRCEQQIAQIHQAVQSLEIYK